MHNNTVPLPTNQTLLQQQSAITFSRATLEISRDTGEKAASTVGGSHLSFSKILAEETEKQRRQLHFKQEQLDEQKKAQPLLG